MSGLNRVMIIGHLGRDPEMRYLASGTPVTQFSVAVSRKWKTPEGETKEETEWMNVVIWNKLAEVANEYLHKGSKVYLEGRLQTQSWEKDGVKHYKTQVVASSLIMLDSKPQGQAAPAQAADEEGDPWG